MVILGLILGSLLAKIFLEEKHISHVTSPSNKFTDVDDKCELGFKSNYTEGDCDSVDYAGIFESKKISSHVVTFKDQKSSKLKRYDNIINYCGSLYVRVYLFTFRQASNRTVIDILTRALDVNELAFPEGTPITL